MSSAASQKISPKASPRLPWPLPLRPARIPICASPLASYCIWLGIEQWGIDDPCAVAFFRCQRHAKGRAWPDTILLQRVPLVGLTREGATAIFAGLAAWLHARAQTDAIREEAQP